MAVSREQVAELHGEHVEGSFGGAVADQLGGGGRVTGIAILGQRAKAARDVDDARGGRLTQQRQHGLGDRKGAEEVCAQDALDRVEASGRDRAVGGLADARIVDQDVEAAEFVRDGRSRRSDGSMVGRRRWQ